MVTVKEAAAEFLSAERIAVTGVSRTPEGHGANAVYKRLRARGYDVFAVNPNATEVEGDRCYRSLADIPGGVDGVVIATRPEEAEATVRACAELGVRRVWMHQGPGPGSVCERATSVGRSQGLTVIDGGCPLMFDPAADLGHKVLKLFLSRRGKVPAEV